MALINFNLCFDDEANKWVAVDPETGELKDFTAPSSKKTTTSKKKKKEENESSSPQLILEENKYTLNTAARELLGVEADNKLSIKYKKVNKVLVPIIGTEEAWGTHDGNRLTKSGTVACRGKGHDELAKYGSVFVLVANNDGTDTYILNGNNTQVSIPEAEDENIEVPDEDLVADIESLGGTQPDDDPNAVEINADEFDAMLNSL